MSSFRDLVITQTGEDHVQSLTAPPGPVEGDVEMGLPRPPDAGLDNVFEKLKMGLKLAAYPFTFSVNALTRFEDVTQAGFLTAIGKIPLGEFDDHVKRIIKGEEQVTGRDMLTLTFGAEFRAALDTIPAIPGWMKEVVDPQSPYYGQKLPRASLGGLADFLTDATLSPYAVAGFMPRSLAVATKMDVVAKAGALPVTIPLKLFGKLVFSPETPWGFMLMRLRDPENVLPPVLVNFLKLNAKSLEDKGVRWSKKLNDLAKEEGLSRGAFDRLLGRENPNVRSWRLFEHLGFGHRTLTPEEEVIRKRIVNEVLIPLKDRVIAANPSLRGMDVIRKWDPDTEMLRPFFMMPKNYTILANTIGSKTFLERSSAGLPLKPRLPPYRLRDLKDDNKDILSSLSWFVGQMERSATLHDSGIGVLALFGPKAEKMLSRANPIGLRNLNLTKQQWLYWNEKVHSMTGHSQTKPHILFNQLGERMWDTVKRKVESAGQRNRIIGLWGRRFGYGIFGEPRLGRTTNLTSVLVANQMTALIGGQLASPFKNLSQVLNTAALKGMPATMRGMFKTIAQDEEASILREARKAAGFSNEFSKLAHDNVWDAAGSTMQRLTMGTFNWSESQIRGWAFNVRMSDEMKKLGIETRDQWMGKVALSNGRRVDAAMRSRLISRSFLDAQMTNFTYGLAGRSGLMMHPILRMGLAMQSYSWKQAEFAARLFREDGFAFTRLLALHGWAIETLYHAGGVNAESWLGWGFLPPNGKFGEGPGVEVLSHLQGLLLANNEDDSKAIGVHMDGLRGGLRELFRLFGDPDAHLGTQAALGAAATFGLTSLPVVAIGKTSKAINEFFTGQRESAGGRVWRPVTRDEALKSYFLPSHEQAEANRLRLAETRVRRTYDGVMRKRINKFISALQGEDGEKVMSAAHELFDKVDFRVPLSANKPPPLTPGLWVGDERFMVPTLSMVESRLKEETQRRTVGSGVRAMMDSGWVFQVLAAEYINGAFRDIEAGATRRLK